MKQKKIFILLLILSIQGCDPREIDLPAWESNLLVPLIDADFDIKDITLNEELKLKEGQVGALSLVYRSDPDSVQLNDFFLIPDRDIDFLLPNLPNGIDDFQFSAAFGPDELGMPLGTGVVPPFQSELITENVTISEHFTEAIFETGEIHLVLENGFPFDINAGYKIEVVNADDEGVILTYISDHPLMANSNLTVFPPISLADKRVSNQLNIRVSNLSSNGAPNATISEANQLGVSLSLRDMKLLRATFILPSFTVPVVEHVVTFDIPYGAKLTAAQLSSGLVKAVIDKTVAFPLEVTIVINSATKNGEPLRQTIDLAADRSLEMDLNDLNLDFTHDGQAEANTISFSIKLNSPGSQEPVTIDFTESIAGNIKLMGIQPSGVFGYLGNFRHLLAGGLEMDFFKRIISGSIDFDAPSVTAYVYNEFGTGVSFKDNGDLYVKGANPYLYPEKEVFLTESLKLLKIEPAAMPGGKTLSRLKLDSDIEPNFNDLISLLPSDVSFSFPVQIGTMQEDLTQFALDTSMVSGYIEIEFPLIFEANALTFTDTLDVDVNFENSYSDILSGDLIAVATNWFPLELLMQVYFKDDGENVLDSLFSERRLITPGEVNDMGKIITPSEVKFVVTLDADAVENLNKSSYVQPVFELNTSGDDKVKIFSDSRVNLKINGDFQVVLKNQ